MYLSLLFLLLNPVDTIKVDTITFEGKVIVVDCIYKDIYNRQDYSTTILLLVENTDTLNSKRIVIGYDGTAQEIKYIEGEKYKFKVAHYSSLKLFKKPDRVIYKPYHNLMESEYDKYILIQ